MCGCEPGYTCPRCLEEERLRDLPDEPEPWDAGDLAGVEIDDLDY